MLFKADLLQFEGRGKARNLLVVLSLEAGVCATLQAGT